jgi:hypothetical protein
MNLDFYVFTKRGPSNFLFFFFYKHSSKKLATKSPVSKCLLYKKAVKMAPSVNLCPNEPTLLIPKSDMKS